MSPDERTVYVATVHDRRTNIFALSTEDGSAVWKMQAKAGFFASPELSQDGSLLYLCDMERYLYQFYADTGNEKQVFRISEYESPLREMPGKGVKSSPKVTKEGVAYVAVESGRFIALDMVNGKLKWEYDLGDCEYLAYICNPVLSCETAEGKVWSDEAC